MRKVLLLPALAVALVAVLVGAGPAQAAGPYTIVGQGAYTYAPVVQHFEVTRCDSSLLSSPLNGLDARIVNVSAFAGRAVTISWKTPHSAALPGLGVAAFVRGWTSSCQAIYPGTTWNINSGSMRTTTLPSGTKWLAVFALGGVNVSFTIT